MGGENRQSWTENLRKCTGVKTNKPDKQQKWAEKPGQWELYKLAQGGEWAGDNRVK